MTIIFSKMLNYSKRQKKDFFMIKKSIKNTKKKSIGNPIDFLN